MKLKIKEPDRVPTAKLADRQKLEDSKKDLCTTIHQVDKRLKRTIRNG